MITLSWIESTNMHQLKLTVNWAVDSILCDHCSQFAQTSRGYWQRNSRVKMHRTSSGPTELVCPQRAVHFLATSSSHNETLLLDSTSASEEVQASIAGCSELNPQLDMEPSCSSHGPTLAATPPPTFAKSTAFAEPNGITPPSLTLALLL